MSNDSDTMLAKVRKLLAKAEDAAASPAEAELYNAKAAELIAAYGIERARLALDETESDALEQRTVTVSPPYARDKIDLLSAVATALRAKTVYLPSRGAKTVHLFGYASDLDRTEMLYRSLVVQAVRGLPQAAPRFGHRQSVAAYRRSWLAGFTAAIRHRLDEAEQRAHEAGAADSSSLALALADRTAQVEAMRADHYPHLRAASRSLSGGGRGSGYRAGQRADLDGARMGPGRRPALGGRAR